jgi:hypothetical protein
MRLESKVSLPRFGRIAMASFAFASVCSSSLGARACGLLEDERLGFSGIGRSDEVATRDFQDGDRQLVLNVL